MEWLERWGYLALGVGAWLAYIVSVFVTTKHDPATGRFKISPTLFGWFADYVNRRGGLTRREALGWAFVLGLMVFIVAIALIFGPTRGRP